MMKYILITIAAVLLVGCGESKISPKTIKTKPETSRVKAPKESISWIIKDLNSGLSQKTSSEVIELINQHLAAGTPVDKVTDMEGHTPLICAMCISFEKSIDVIKLLITSGANIHKRTSSGVSPIHLAAEENSIEIIKILIDKGADINLESLGDNYLPLDYASDEKVKSFIIENGGKSGAELSINTAASLGNTEAVKNHLSTGVDVNAQDDNGLTPLFNAAYMEHGEIVELLIGKGANVNAKSKHGDTALDWATGFDTPQIADLLRKHGGKKGEELKAEGK
jgi:ankyrin repeat protein